MPPQQNEIDVLVVDDIPDAAKDYAELISAKTGLQTTHTDDPAQALEILSSASVKVLVLDQKMPVPGTELYKQARKRNQSFRAIMLTGEATPGEVGEALVRLGFKDYVGKNEVVTKLPQSVLHEYVAYQAEVAAAALEGARPVVLQRRSGLLPWSRVLVTYRLRRVELIDEQFIPKDGWHTFLTLHVGQTIKATTGIAVEHGLVLESETVDKLTAQLGFGVKDVADLKTQLQAELTTRFKQTTSTKSTATASLERSFQLPAEPVDPNELHVTLRRMQRAAVYRRIRAELVSDCVACGVQSDNAIDVLVPAGRTAVRHEDRLSNGELRILDLGSE